MLWYHHVAQVALTFLFIIVSKERTKAPYQDEWEGQFLCSSVPTQNTYFDLYTYKFFNPAQKDLKTYLS